MKKNKKFLLSSLVAAVLVAGGGYLYADASIIKNAELEANYKIFNSVDEMINDADIIIKATVTDESQNVLNTQDGFTDGYTLTKVNVDKVLKGDEAIEKTVFTVAEPTYVVDNGVNPGQTRFSYEEYSKLEADSKYILFIKQTDGKHWVNALQQGKYNIDDKDTAEKELYAKGNNYKALKDAVLAKFSTQ